MNIGFTEQEYSRVRNWILAAFKVAPAVFTEAEMLDKLRSNEWHLVTTEHAACVLQFFEEDGRKAANIIVIGGVQNGSLREIMQAHFVLCDALRNTDFSYIVGEPRKEWHRYLLKFGFEQHGKEFIKRL